MIRTFVTLTAALVCLTGAASAQTSSDSGNPCGSLKNGYGPFDYRTSAAELEVVERFHYTPDVEQLRRGSTGTVGGDLDYTLRASPNHHRALNTLVRLASRTHSQRPLGPMAYTVDCYFDRALRFARDDGTVRIIYGIYLAGAGKKQEAARVLEEARKYEPNNVNLEYNLGLIYLDLKDIPHALDSAQRAYRLGAQLPGLRNKLKAAGVSGLDTLQPSTGESGKSK